MLLLVSKYNLHKFSQSELIVIIGRIHNHTATLLSGESLSSAVYSDWPYLNAKILINLYNCKILAKRFGNKKEISKIFCDYGRDYGRSHVSLVLEYGGEGITQRKVELGYQQIEQQEGGALTDAVKEGVIDV